MSFLSRNFGTLFFLALVGGLALGVVMARQGIEVDLGTVGGYRLVLTTASATKTPQVIIAANPAVPTPAANATPTAQSANPGGFGAGQGMGRTTSGTVGKIEGKTITVATQDGTATTVSISDNTIFQKMTTATIADIKIGDPVTVVGQVGSNGVISAQQVTLGAAGPTAGALAAGQRQGAGGRAGGAPAGGGFVTGVVQKIEGTTLTVAAEGGQTTAAAAVGPDTRVRRVAAGSLADVSTGDSVTVIGQPTAAGSWTALIVQIDTAR